MIMLMVWALHCSRDFVKLGTLEINSVYFPIIYAVLMIILGSNYKNYAAGFLVGVVFGIIKSPTFQRQHGDYLPTPGFLKAYFRDDREV